MKAGSRRSLVIAFVLSSPWLLPGCGGGSSDPVPPVTSSNPPPVTSSNPPPVTAPGPLRTDALTAARAAAFGFQMPANYGVGGTIPSVRVVFFPSAGDATPQPCPGGGTGRFSYPRADESPDVGDVITITTVDCTTGAAGVDRNSTSGTSTTTLEAANGDNRKDEAPGQNGGTVRYRQDIRTAFDKVIAGRAFKGEVTTVGTCEQVLAHDGRTTDDPADDTRTMTLDCSARSTGTENGAAIALDFTGRANCRQAAGAMTCDTAVVTVRGQAANLGTVAIEATLVSPYTENRQAVPDARYRIAVGSDVVDLRLTNAAPGGSVTVTAPDGSTTSMTFAEFRSIASLY